MAWAFAGRSALALAVVAPLSDVASGIESSANAAAPTPGGPFGLFNLGNAPPGPPGRFILGDGVRGGIKIGENESPRPTDRVFFNYNFFSDGTYHLHRETIGFEKTFLDGDASIGLRLPFVQDNFRSDIGDISVILKGILYGNADTGNLLSGGLEISIPTSGGSAVAQPFFGWTMQPPGGPFFLQGFHSVLIPLQSGGSTLLANSIGIGASLPGSGPGGFIAGIVPTVELHLNTPLQAVQSSSLDAAIGGHIVFVNGSSLGLGVALPLAGPKPYDFEATVNFNFQF